MTDKPEFSGFKGRFFAWFLTSPMRRILEMKMGKPEARIMSLLNLQGDEVLLDMGCGSGFHTLLVAAQLPRGRVIAMDVSTEMLDRLRSSAKSQGLAERIDVQLADGLQLPMDENSVDCALSAAVWHHLSDPAKACQELARVVRPGGRIVVSDLAFPPDSSAESSIPGHTKAFAASDMETIFNQAGLIDVRVESVGRWLVGVATKSGA